MMIHGANPSVRFSGVRQRPGTFTYGGQEFHVTGRHARRLAELEAAARSYEADQFPIIMYPNPSSELEDYKAKLAHRAGYRPSSGTSYGQGPDDIPILGF